MGYAIVKLDTGEAVSKFTSLPKAFEVVINGHTRRIIAPVTVGDEGLGYRFVNWNPVGFDQPGRYFTQGGDVDSFDGALTLTTTRQWTAWTQAQIDADVAAARQRLANQFDDLEDLTRASVLVLGKAVRDVLNAATQASTFADFKNRMATVAANTPSTPAEFKAAVLARLGQ